MKEKTPQLSGKNFSNKTSVMRSGLLLAVLQTVLFGCGNAVDPAAGKKDAPPPKVKLTQVVSEEVTEWDEYTGRVEAVHAVDIRARAEGYLEKVTVKAGEKVSKGDLLFLIDPKPYKAKLNYAIAELERARTKLDLAKNDLGRAENLFKAKAISGEAYDKRSKDVREAAAAVTSAEASVNTARLDLDYCEIRAPISGRISREQITEGNLVNGGNVNVLASIVSTDPVYVYVDADEQSVLKYRRQALKDGKKKSTVAQLALTDETGYPHTGHIDYISPREQSDTGTVTLRAVFSNPDELISPGFFARLRLRGSEPYQALLLPERAIGIDLAQRFVWVIDKDNKAEYRKITPGALIDNRRVIKEGLQSGEWVVVEGQQKLKPGIKVEPEKTTPGESQGAK